MHAPMSSNCCWTLLYLTFSNSIIGSMLSMGWIPEFSSWLNPFCDDVSSTYAIFLLDVVCLIQSECFGGTLKPHKRRRRRLYTHITQLPSKLLSQKTDRKWEPISSRHILLQISYMFKAKGLECGNSGMNAKSKISSTYYYSKWFVLVIHQEEIATYWTLF